MANLCATGERLVIVNRAEPTGIRAGAIRHADAEIETLTAEGTAAAEGVVAIASVALGTATEATSARPNAAMSRLTSPAPR